MTNYKLKSRIIEIYSTQSDFAVHLKLTDSYVSRVVCGREKLSSEQKQKWAQVLGCDYKILFSDQ